MHGMLNGVGSACLQPCLRCRHDLQPDVTVVLSCMAGQACHMSLAIAGVFQCSGVC